MKPGTGILCDLSRSSGLPPGPMAIRVLARDYERVYPAPQNKRRPAT
jgi:hypothetical protein